MKVGTKTGIGVASAAVLTALGVGIAVALPGFRCNRHPACRHRGRGR